MWRIRCNHRYERRYRRGAAATEFAFVAPTIILFALAAMDFGRIAFIAEVVSNSTRTGAETGSTRQFTSETEAMWKDKVQEAIVQEMQNVPGFREADLETNIATDVDADGIKRITVDVSYPFRTLVTWPALPSEVQVHEKVQYRQFR